MDSAGLPLSSDCPIPTHEKEVSRQSTCCTSLRRFFSICFDVLRSVPFAGLVAFFLKITFLIVVIEAAYALDRTASVLLDKDELIEDFREILMTFELADTFCSAFALLGIAFTSGKIGELVFGDKRHWWRCVCGKWVQRILRLLCWFFFLVTLAFLAIYSAAAIVAVIFDALCKAKPILAHVSAILKKVNGMSQQIATKVSTAQTELDLATGKTLAVDGQVDLAVDQIARLRAFTQDVENRLAPACRAVHNLLTGGFPAVRLVSAPFLLAVAQALFLTSITASIERIRTAEAIGTQDEGYREKTGKEKELEGEDLEDSGRDSDGKLPNPAADAAKEGGEGEGGSSSSPHPVEGGGSLRIPNDADRSPLSYAVGERGPDHTDECLADLPDPSSEGLEEGTGPLFPD